MLLMALNGADALLLFALGSIAVGLWLVITAARPKRHT